MHSDDFSIYSRDRALTSLARLSQHAVLNALAENVCAPQFPERVFRYSIDNLRYKPGQKMVLGLTAPDGRQPIAIRIFPPGQLKRRLEQARRDHAKSVFALPQIDGIAWLFPAERKLQLKIVADEKRLQRCLWHHRQLWIKQIQLQRFVPEHTYTARVTGRHRDGQLRNEFIKVHYDRSGNQTARIMNDLAALVGSAGRRRLSIDVPDSVLYLPAHRMLVQSSLQRDTARSCSDEDIAGALAQLHGLPVRHAPAAMSADPDQVVAAVSELLATTFAHLKSRIVTLWDQVCQARARVDSRRQHACVAIHGDVHLGNFFPLKNGRTGVIDFDSFGMGDAERDLGSYFCFKLWLAIRAGNDPVEVLNTFPQFIDCYNRQASRYVDLHSATVTVAQKLISERIYRGLARGKLSSESELQTFINLTELCLAQSTGTQTC